MPADEGEYADEIDGIPSFGDLVRELEAGSGSPVDDVGIRSPARSAEGGGATTDDLAGLTENFDASKWQWGGGTDGDATVAEPASSPSTHTVDGVLDRIGDAANVLLVGPQESTVDAEICGRVMGSAGSAQRRQTIVTTDGDPDEWLERQRTYGTGEFDRMAIIVVGDTLRGGNERATTNQIAAETLTLSAIHDRRDLTRLGLLISKHLGDGRDPSPVLCFHSLTTLVQSVEIEKLLRFLHELRGRVGQAGARAHYHLDPRKVDPTILETITEQFDIAIRFDDDGTVSVTS